MAVTLAAITAGGVVVTQDAPPAEGTANIWIDSNGGTCLDSASAVAYSDAAACTPDAANDTCDGGDTVLIKGGSYTSQWTLTGTNSRSSRCTMTVADGETVTMGYLNLGEYNSGTKQGPDWLTIQGNETEFAGCRDKTVGTCSLRFSTYDITHTNQITIANFEGNANAVVDQCFHSEDADNLVVKRGVLHNCRADGTTGAMMYSSGGPQTFEDLYAYDGLRKVNWSGDPHTECLYATSVTGLTLRRVHFYSCDAEIVFVTGGSTAPDYVIENSIFQVPNGANNNSVKFRTGGAPSPYPTNLLMRNNIFASVTGPDSCSSCTGTVVNNFFWDGGAFCGGSITCSNNDTSEPDSSFADPDWQNCASDTPCPRGDFTIQSGSGLRNAGTNGNCPSIDFAGNDRPKGGTCDIGAYEYQE